MDRALFLIRNLLPKNTLQKQLGKVCQPVGRVAYGRPGCTSKDEADAESAEDQ